MPPFRRAWRNQTWWLSRLAQPCGEGDSLSLPEISLAPSGGNTHSMLMQKSREHWKSCAVNSVQVCLRASRSSAAPLRPLTTDLRLCRSVCCCCCLDRRQRKDGCARCSCSCTRQMAVLVDDNHTGKQAHARLIRISQAV